jgi:hypothetical protein
MNKICVLLQAGGGIGFSQLIIALLSIGFFVLIFFALRGLMLWYWKVDAIVSNQTAQTELLKMQNFLIEQQTEFLRGFKTQPGNNATDYI